MTEKIRSVNVADGAMLETVWAKGSETLLMRCELRVPLVLPLDVLQLVQL
jgi:hypothetical protein